MRTSISQSGPHKTRHFLCMTVVLVAAAPIDPHPLSESQLVRLETASDSAGTIDEAALYALLENAADWSERDAGAVVPDYDAIRREPDDWRGVRCLIEGTIYRVLRPELSRRGWEKVQGVVVRIDHSREPPAAHDFVIVYLTDPPQWAWPNPRYEKEGIAFHEPRPVRLVGRFYKVSSFETHAAGAERAYLTFVGRRVTFPQTTESSRRASWPGVPVLLGLLIVLVAFTIWRLKALGRRADRPSRLADYLQQRQAQRTIRGDSEEDVMDEPAELPENPAEALDTLADQRRPIDE